MLAATRQNMSATHSRLARATTKAREGKGKGPRGQNEGTHELDAPPKERGLEVLLIGERTTLEDLDRVDNGDATVKLAAGDVIVKVLHTGA